jgi:UDP-N-acetylmuramoylalanine--D-glutamate ligase
MMVDINPVRSIDLHLPSLLFILFIMTTLQTSNGVNYADYFKGKRVTVMGLGLLGRGIGDAAYIAASGAKEVIVTDLKTEEILADSVAQLREYENVRFVLGEHRFEDFENVDLILVAAGVPYDSPYVEHARNAGVELKQSAALFAELSRIPIIGVTGTRGKSTVTHMIHHVLSFITGEPILLGGNVRGVSNLQLLNDATPDSLCVMELDSWQLQGFGWSGISPTVAVFTTFMEDHLNYYERNGRTHEEAMAAYFTDKAQIFLHQEESGVFITTPAVFEWVKKVFPRGTLGMEVVLADTSVLPEDMLLSMPGEHNRLNASLAYEALRATGMTDEEIFAGLATFPGVEGRLQLVATVNNVRIYNDNNATTPQATTVALEALDQGNKNIILIAGGADKNIDPTGLAYAITQHCKNVFLTPGSGTDNLLGYLDGGDTGVSVMGDLKLAFAEATRLATAGDIILFSPAFASFAQYKNEYERNDEFMMLVDALVDSSIE